MLAIFKTFSSVADSPDKKNHDLEALGPWSRDIANNLAAEEGIRLTSAHWEVLEVLRNHYQEYGPDTYARSLLNCMVAELSDRGGRKYLYELFPHGPVNQACRIAGLPLPPHSSDTAFGSVM